MFSLLYLGILVSVLCHFYAINMDVGEDAQVGVLGASLLCCATSLFCCAASVTTVLDFKEDEQVGIPQCHCFCAASVSWKMMSR